MVLPKRESEMHLPALEVKEGITICMLDMDGIHEWSFKYRFWPNNSSRMYVLEHTGDFVDAHGLAVHDFILVYQNNEDGQYIIEARKKGEDDSPRSCNNVGMCELSNELTVPEHPTLGSADLLYEYESIFMDDSPLNYMGEPINLPNMGSDSSFDNYNVDDFEFDYMG
ncbi:hypothetical protein ACS0TY_004735 [Phlomoides rotata]